MKRNIRPLLSLILIGLLSASLAAQRQPEPEESIAVLVDLSFSMGLPDSPGADQSRLERGTRIVEDLVDRALAGSRTIELAVLSYDDEDVVQIEVPFTQNRSDLLRALDPLAPWGRTDTNLALRVAAAYLNINGDGKKRSIFLVSDCVETSADQLGFPDLSSLAAANIGIVVLGFPLSDNPKLSAERDRWADAWGLPYFEPGSAGSAIAVLLEGDAGVPRLTLPAEPPRPLPEPRPAVAVPAASAEAATTPAGSAPAPGQAPATTTAEGSRGPAKDGPEVTEPTQRPAPPGKAPAPEVRLVKTRIPRRAFVRTWWIILILLIGVAGYMLLEGRIWLTRWRAARDQKGKKSSVVTLRVQTPDGESSVQTFRIPMVVIGPQKTADLVLSRPAKGSRMASFRLQVVGAEVRLTSRNPLVINGVGRRSRVLKAHDRIAYGRYRVRFEGIAFEDVPPPPVPSPRFLFALPIAFFLVALGVIFRHPVEIRLPDEVVRTRIVIQPLPGGLAMEGIAGDLSPPGGSGGNASAGGDGEGAQAEGAGDAEAAPDAAGGGEAADAAAVGEAKAGADPEPAGAVVDPGAVGEVPAFDPVQEPRPFSPPNLTVIPPGAPAPAEGVDLLFFHAHPDDESIDFGVLIARAARAGLRVAVVLFTDGESGIDQYPRRIVDGSYPARDLAGAELSSIRVRETAAALTVLGAGTYLRLGLPNNPYNRAADVISHARLIEKWGGRDRLVDRVVELLTRLEPRVVVSPEGPSEAREHFEHETVGMIVEEAIRSYEAGRGRPLMGVLRSVDPLQKHAYSGLVGIDGMEPGIPGGQSMRAVQAAALSRHMTQRDASVIAVENLTNFGSEYYRVVRWDLTASIEQFFSGDLHLSEG